MREMSDLSIRAIKSQTVNIGGLLKGFYKNDNEPVENLNIYVLQLKKPGIGPGFL